MYIPALLLGIFSTIGYIYAQNGTVIDQEPDSPLQSIVVLIGALSGIILAFIALARDFISSKAIRDRLTAEQIAQVNSSLDFTEQMLTKVTETSEEQKETADVLYNQLMPEESKKIINAEAIKFKTLAEKLNKHQGAVKRIRELIVLMKAGEITPQQARIQRDAIMNEITNTPTAAKIKDNVNAETNIKKIKISEEDQKILDGLS